MKRNHTSQKVLLVVISLIALSLPAQETPKFATIRLVDGKTGKPMGNERLLVFFGASPEGVRFHDGGSLDLHTDTDGVADLPLNRPASAYFQVFVDHRTLCQNTPNYRSFRLEDVRQHGSHSPNDCGKIALPLSPGQLIVYARDASVREKMNW